MTAEEKRREWARPYIARCVGPVPFYGSEEWNALDDADPRKVGAVVLAAEREANGREMDDLQLRLELDAAAAQVKRADDAAWTAARQAHRAGWDGRSGTFRHDPQYAAEVAAEVEAEWREWVGGAV